MSSKTLVIVLGQLRAHSLTWDNFKQNVLDELNADLAVCVPNDSFFDFANPYYLNARYRWLVPDAPELSGTYDRIQSILKGTEDWRVLCDTGGSWLGKIAQSKQPGAASILYVLRWFMLNNIAAAGLSEVYNRFVITRSDYFYLCPHPPIDCLDLNKLWIPDGENYGGICDRHLVVSSADLVPACNLIDDLLLRPLKVRAEMIASEYCNIERLIELHYRRNGLIGRVRRFPFVMFLVRDEDDPTAWSVGQYLPNMRIRVKYLTELREAERFRPLLRSSSEWRLFFAARRDTDSSPPGLQSEAHQAQLCEGERTVAPPQQSAGKVPSKEEIGGNQMAQYHVAIIRPEGSVQSDGFLELAESLCAGLRNLGHWVAQGENTIDAAATNIVLGAHLLTEEDSKLLPPSTIIFNLEPIGSARLPEWYAGLAARHRIWDYSALNLRHWNLLPLATPPLLVEIGFVPELRHIVNAPVQDIDVLYYGSLNDRRSAVINALRNAGLQVVAVFALYGRQCGPLIARSKVVLNIHYPGTEFIEVLRLSYLLANAKAVVSEAATDLGHLGEAIVIRPYEELVETCVALVHDEAARIALERKGAEWFEQRDQAAILRKVLAAAPHTEPRHALPGAGISAGGLNSGAAPERPESTTPTVMQVDQSPPPMSSQMDGRPSGTASEIRPTVCGMAVVKNEADVIEASIRHNLRFLDRFIVLDDGSVDDTRNILAKLSKELPNLIVRRARQYGNTQSERMTALLKEQRVESRPDFVVFLDADEFLDPGPDGDFQAQLQAIPCGGYGLYPSCTFVLTPENLAAGPQDILPVMRRRRRQEEPQFFKVILRLETSAAVDILIGEGNHSAHAADGSKLPNIVIPGLRLLHFPIRSRDQLVAKSVIPWMRFLMQNEGALRSQANWHWQAWFDRVAEGHAWSDESVCRASMFYAQEINPEANLSIDWEKDLVEEPFWLCYERRYSSGACLPALALIARSWQESILREQEKQRLQRPQQRGQPLGDRYTTLLARLLNQGRTQEALAFLDKELAAGQSCEMLNIRSTVQYSLGDVTEAEKGYKRAAELEPAAKEPVTNLLHILFTEGRLAEAIPLIRTKNHLLNDGDWQRFRQLLARAQTDQSGLPVDSFLKKVPGVIHIGANTGQERQLYASIGLNVLWVEPIPAVFEVLRSNIAGFANQRACSYLLAAEHGKEYSLHVADNEGASSSIFPFAQHQLLWPDIHFTHDISITATTLARLIEKERIDLRSYGALVLDTQGSELLVLKGALPVLDKFRFVKAEVANFESYTGCCQMDELTDFMRQQGFIATGKSLFASRDGVGDYYDVLYSRP